MACCYRFDTEVLLANLFVNSKYPVSYSYEDVHNYFRYLTDKFPIYLYTNLSEQALYDCSKCYPELYSVYKKDNGEVIIRSKSHKPSLNYFNSLYQSGCRYYLESISEEYVKEKESETSC